MSALPHADATPESRSWKARGASALSAWASADTAALPLDLFRILAGSLGRQSIH